MRAFFLLKSNGAHNFSGGPRVRTFFPGESKGACVFSLAVQGSVHFFPGRSRGAPLDRPRKKLLPWTPLEKIAGTLGPGPPPEKIARNLGPGLRKNCMNTEQVCSTQTLEYRASVYSYSTHITRVLLRAQQGTDKQSDSHTDSYSS